VFLTFWVRRIHVVVNWLVFVHYTLPRRMQRAPAIEAIRNNQCPNKQAQKIRFPEGEDQAGNTQNQACRRHVKGCIPLPKNRPDDRLPNSSTVKPIGGEEVNDRNSDTYLKDITKQMNSKGTQRVAGWGKDEKRIERINRPGVIGSRVGD